MALCGSSQPHDAMSQITAAKNARRNRDADESRWIRIVAVEINDPAHQQHDAHDGLHGSQVREDARDPVDVGVPARVERAEHEHEAASEPKQETERSECFHGRSVTRCRWAMEGIGVRCCAALKWYVKIASGPEGGNHAKSGLRTPVVPVFGAGGGACYRAGRASRAPERYEKYVVRVPTEGNVATQSIELRMPANVDIVSIGAPNGYTYEAKRTELENHLDRLDDGHQAGRVCGVCVHGPQSETDRRGAVGGDPAVRRRHVDGMDRAGKGQAPGVGNAGDGAGRLGEPGLDDLVVATSCRALAVSRVPAACRSTSNSPGARSWAPSATSICRSLRARLSL